MTLKKCVDHTQLAFVILAWSNSYLVAIIYVVIEVDDIVEPVLTTRLGRLFHHLIPRRATAQTHHQRCIESHDEQIGWGQSRNFINFNYSLFCIY
jgi:hypothetical protein